MVYLQCINLEALHLLRNYDIKMKNCNKKVCYTMAQKAHSPVVFFHSQLYFFHSPVLFFSQSSFTFLQSSFIFTQSSFNF